MRSRLELLARPTTEAPRNVQSLSLNGVPLKTSLFPTRLLRSSFPEHFSEAETVFAQGMKNNVRMLTEIEPEPGIDPGLYGPSGKPFGRLEGRRNTGRLPRLPGISLEPIGIASCPNQGPLGTLKGARFGEQENFHDFLFTK